MPYTIPAAEIIGSIVGITVGRFCARHGRQIAREQGLPELIGGLAGATVGHYLAGAATKICINVMGLDAVGVALSAGITTPIAALSHGLVEGLATGLHDLGLDECLKEIDLSGFVNGLFDGPDLQLHLQDLSNEIGVHEDQLPSFNWPAAALNIDDSANHVGVGGEIALGHSHGSDLLLLPFDSMTPPSTHPLDGIMHHDDELYLSGSLQPIPLIAELDFDYNHLALVPVPSFELPQPVAITGAIDFNPGHLDTTVHLDGDSTLHHTSPYDDGVYQPFSSPGALSAMCMSQGDHPLCGLFSIFHQAQIAHPELVNSAINNLLDHGVTDINHPLDMAKYEPLLHSIGIHTQWVEGGDIQLMLKTVNMPGGSVGIYGDPYYLDDPLYHTPVMETLHVKNPEQFYHAITLVEPWVNGHGQLLGFTGIDSNHDGHVMHYTFEQVKNFLCFAYGKANPYAGKVLLAWP